MKKILFILFALLLTSGLFSQENQVPVKSDFIEQVEYTYCELLGTRKFLSTKVVVEIDFGQANSFWKNTRLLKDENGKAVSFNSMVDAMNFMGSLGWEFVQAFVVTEGNQNVYHWLLKIKKDTKLVEP
ncbi:hypothetical protein [Petrimonas sp.]|uniref:hypothetical protein n=1 Tax=Petrimonas sp. TaxID=2023866 RepID=UPI003F517885